MSRPDSQDQDRQMHGLLDKRGGLLERCRNDMKHCAAVEAFECLRSFSLNFKRKEVRNDMPLNFDLPVLRGFAGFRANWLKSDISAGLAIAAVGLPSAIAYPAIAGLPPKCRRGCRFRQCLRLYA